MRLVYLCGCFALTFMMACIGAPGHGCGGPGDRYFERAAESEQVPAEQQPESLGHEADEPTGGHE